jgi:RsiW-degrading membrane proteinase PrsW (M82 family)
VIYFAIAGLGFGVPENILYTLQFGAKVGLARIVLTPFFHAATTCMVGYFLIKAKLKETSMLVVGLVLVGAMALHGLYDFGLISGMPLFIVLSLMITVVMATGIFLFYMRATELDQAKGLSRIGIANFCRHCGQANPKHMLFCTACGQRA